MVRPRSRQGFTLIEMMLVLLVIGVLSALILPGLSEVMADNRQAAAAEGLVRMHRVVRARVNETGLAHLMMYSDAATNGHGDIFVYEGMNNRCISTPWADVIASTAASRGHYPVATLDMATANVFDPGSSNPSISDDDRHVITVRAAQLSGGSVSALSVVNLCVQPNGMTYMTTTSGSWAFVAQASPLQFTFRRTVDGLQHGVDRRVLLPVGGQARMRL